jgi:hypothetical protein
VNTSVCNAGIEMHVVEVVWVCVWRLGDDDEGVVVSAALPLCLDCYFDLSCCGAGACARVRGSVVSKWGVLEGSEGYVLAIAWHHCELCTRHKCVDCLTRALCARVKQSTHLCRVHNSQ